MYCMEDVVCLLDAVACGICQRLQTACHGTLHNRTRNASVLALRYLNLEGLIHYLNLFSFKVRLLFSLGCLRHAVAFRPLLIHGGTSGEHTHIWDRDCHLLRQWYPQRGFVCEPFGTLQALTPFAFPTAATIRVERACMLTCMLAR
jgi:hypothetical protein